MRYDIELFLSDVETYLKANLNTKLTAINAEKADSITLKPVDDAAYFCQSLNDSVTNYNPFVYYGVDSIESNGIGPATSNGYKVEVAIVVSDQGESLDVNKRIMFRYHRALTELFQEGYASVARGVKIKVQSLVPISVQLMNSSAEARAIGVTLDFTLA